MRPWTFLAALGAFAVPAVAESGADKVAGLVEMVEHNRPGHARSLRARGLGAQDVTLSEAEVNGYLADLLPARVKEVRRATVRFLDGRVVDAEAAVGLPSGALDRLPGDTPAFIRQTLERLLKAENAVRVEAMFTSAKGKGFVQVRRVKLNGIPVPDAFVRELMEFAGAKARPPVDFHRLFELRNGVEKAEILPGAVRLRVNPN